MYAMNAVIPLIIFKNIQSLFHLTFVVLEKVHTSQPHLHLEMKQISPTLLSNFFVRSANRRTQYRHQTIIENNHNIILFDETPSLACFHTEPFASSPPSIRSNARRACIATSNSGSSCAAFNS